jgi:recombination protein RecR
MSPIIQQLIHIFSRLPGLGPRSARRICVHLLQHKQKTLSVLLQSLSQLNEKLEQCTICANWDTNQPCFICSDLKRNSNQLCIVETIADMWALERAKVFNGYYHVLGGALCAISQISPKDLNTDTLIQRLSPPTKFKEVIIATNSTMEGQTTMHYLMNLLKDFPIETTMLAQGVPVGGELDFLDQATLFSAFFSRHKK